jgi:hypothetical protein
MASQTQAQFERGADLIEHGGYCSLCRVYGVSKNGLRQWCIDYDLPYKAADLEGMGA